MSVQDILAMPASEVAGWFAHFKLSAAEAKREREKQRHRSKPRRRRR